MNPSGLSRLLFSSVLALLLVGGLMSAQAQETVTVDQDGGEDELNIQDGLSTLNTDVGNNANTSAGILVVVAGDYTGDGNIQVGSNGATGNIEDLTIEVRRDVDSDVDELTLESLDLAGGTTVTNVTVTSTEGTEFIRLTAAGGSGQGDLDLDEGTLLVQSDVGLRLAGGTDVFRTAEASMDDSGVAPTFQGLVNLTYNVSAGDLTAGLEAASDLSGGTLTINDAGTGNAVVFNKNLTAGSFTYTGGDVEFTGDFTVGSDFTVSDGDAFEVGGTLTQTNNNPSLTVNGDGSSPEGTLNVGSLNTTWPSGSAGGDVIVGDGQVTVGTLTLNLDFNNDGADQTIDVDLNANGSSANFTVSDVNPETISDSDETDEIAVDVDNINDGAVSVGGTLRELNNGSASSSLTLTGTTTVDGSFVNGSSGEVNVTGQTTYDFSAAGSAIDNSGGGTITIQSGATLTVTDANGAGATSVVLSNSGANGLTGQGTLVLEGDSGDILELETLSGDQQLGNIRAEVETSILDNTSGSPATVNAVNTGSLTANDVVNVGDGATGDVSFGNVIVNANVNFGDGTLGSVGTVTLGTLEANSATIDFTPVDAGSGDVVDAQTVDLNDGGTIDISGSGAVTLQVNRDFMRASAPGAVLTTDNNSRLEFLGSNEATFDSGSIFTINGTVLVDKPDGRLNLAEAIRMNGDFTVTSSSSFVDTEFVMNDFLQMGATASQTTATPQAGVFTASSTIETTGDFALMFTPNGNTQYDIAGTDTLDNVIVRNDVAGGDPVVRVVDNVEFKGTVTLRSGGLNATGDFSPVGDEAEVVRWINSTNTAFMGSFNADQNPYDLRYTRNGSNDTASEITDEVRNLTVDANSVPQLDDSYDINGELFVAADGQISDDGGGSRTLNLVSDGMTHTINGFVGGATNVVSLNVTADNVTINGGSGTNIDHSQTQDIRIAGSGTVIDGLQEILGRLNVDSGDLTLTMQMDQRIAENTLSPTNEGLTVNDSLSLGSDVDIDPGNSSNDEVFVTSSGKLNLGGSDLTLTGNGGSSADFNGDGGAQYFSDGGAVVFDASGGNTTFGTAGEIVPRVTVEQAIQLSENTATDVLLTANANIDLNGSDFEVSGEVAFDGGDIIDVAGGGVFRSVGTTISSQATVNISRFEVDSAPNTTELVSPSGSFDPQTELLLTGGILEITDGTQVNSFAPTVTVDSADVVNPDGTFILNTIGNAISLNPVAGADDSLEVTNLDVFSNNNAVSFGGDGLNLVIGEQITLDGTFDGSTGDGDLVIADGGTIVRGVADGDATAGGQQQVLREEVSFLGMYNLTYNVSTDVNSGFELVDDSDTLWNLSVGVSGANNVLTFSDADLTGDVTVNGTLTLQDGFVDYNPRHLVLADGATLRQRTNEGLTGTSGSPVDNSPITAEGSYNLLYDSANITTTANEFLDGGVASLQVGAVLSGTPTSGTTTLHADRTVSDFTSVTSGGLTLDDNTLTVEGPAVVDRGTVGGDAGGPGVIASEGSFTLNGGTLTDPNPSPTARTRLDASGSVTINGGQFGANSELAFVGSGDQAFQLAGNQTIPVLTLDQTQNGIFPRVTLSGGNLIVTNLNFGNGLLDTGNNRIQVANFTRGSVGQNDASHVVGTVRQALPGGAVGRFAFPVGTDTTGALDQPQYRPYTLTFDQTDPTITATNIDVTHVDENPGGNVGLPFEDSEGVTTGNYPDFYWLVRATTSLGSQQSFDIELVGDNLGVPFDDEEDLRIIRRFDGNAQNNQWRLQGDASDYDNILEVQGQDSTVTVRNIGSQGGLVTQATRVTIGIPSRAPVFTQAPAAGDTLTVQEDSTLLVNFEAEGRDIGSDLAFSMDNTPDNATFSATSDSTAEFEFTPDFDQQGVYNPIAKVTDNNNSLTTSRSFFVNVQDNTPSFILGSPSGDSLCTAGDVSLVLQESIGLENSPLLPFDLSQRLAADVSGDGEVNAGDASIIKQFVAGLRDSFPGGTPGCSRASGSSTTNARIAADMSQVSGTVGFGSLSNGDDGKTHIPVELEGDVNNVRSVQLTANYDASAMTIEDVASTLPEGWQMVHRVDEDNGIVKIAMAGANAAPAGKIADLKVSIDNQSSSTTIEGSVLLNTSTETALNSKSVSAIPGSFALEANRPNPVQTSTTIEYSLPEQTDVTLEVYNVLGQRVATLVNEKKSAGTYQVNFDASDLSSGVYMYRIEAGTFSESSRMTVIR